MKGCFTNNWQRSGYSMRQKLPYNRIMYPHSRKRTAIWSLGVLEYTYFRGSALNRSRNFWSQCVVDSVSGSTTLRYLSVGDMHTMKYT